MSKEYIDLPERIKAQYLDIDSDIVTDLRHTDADYAALFNQIAEMKKANPFIDKVLEEKGDITMTTEEHSAFVECMRLKRQLDDMERLHTYFRGHTDAFAYLKKIKAI